MTRLERMVHFDLSNVFDCFHHELHIAICLFRCVVTKPNPFLHKQKKNVKINVYSSWIDNFFGVSQVLLFGPLLFNIFLCEIFMVIPNYDVANHADDTTSYSTGKKIVKGFSRFNKNFRKTFNT